jgi:hypothetical protein
MLLMGDRSGSRSGSNQNVITPNKYWGAGRVTMMPFDKLSSYVVQRYQVTLSKNESFNFSHSLPAGTKFYKAVLWHSGKDYVNEPRIDLTLNPTGCGAGTLWVNRLDSKSYAAHKNVNGCTGMNVTFKDTPVGSSGTRTFHFASYAVPQTHERQF